MLHPLCNPKCPDCGHGLTLADLARMVQAEGWATVTAEGWKGIDWTFTVSDGVQTITLGTVGDDVHLDVGAFAT